jgi:CBS domain-containing protein
VNIAQLLKAKGRAVTTARPGLKLLDIIASLASKRIGAIIIVGDKGELAGIISERDIIHALAKSGEAVLQDPVSKHMTRDVVTCQESTTIDEVMELMTQGRFRHITVIEDGALVGIISIGDVVKNHIAEVEMEVTAMRGYFATG